MDKRGLIIIIVIALVTASSFIATQQPSPRMCQADDGDCMRLVEEGIERCIPSSRLIDGEGMTIQVNTSIIDGECVITEKVINVSDGPNITGYENECRVAIGDGPSGCPGSIYDYVVREGGSGGSGSPGSTEPGGAVHLDCRMDDDACKEALYNNIYECVPTVADDVELKWDPDGFWTRHITISRQGACSISIEITNAVNIPPGEPADIIGMKMDCAVPEDSLPISGDIGGFCSGRLLEYLQTL